MDREAFRARIARYKLAKLSNPDAKFWDIPRYDEGTGSIEKIDNRVTYEGYNTKGLRWVGTNSTMNMPEITVIGDKSKIKKKEKSTALEVAEWLPWISDGLDAAYVVDDALKGNYGSALAGAAMFAIPNIIEKPVKKIAKVAKRVWNGANIPLIDTNKDWAINRVRNLNIDEDIYNAEQNLGRYLRDKNVIERIKYADKLNGNTKYYDLSQRMAYAIFRNNPNINYVNSTITPIKIDRPSGTLVGKATAGSYDRRHDLITIPSQLKSKEVDNVFHHESQHRLDNLSNVNATISLTNPYLYALSGSLKPKSLILMDYGLKNMLFHPMKTAKNWMLDNFYYSKPTEIRAYFSEIFKNRLKNGIPLDADFTDSELNRKSIKHITHIMENSSAFLDYMRMRGFASGGVIEDNTSDSTSTQLSDEFWADRERYTRMSGRIDPVFSLWDTPLGLARDVVDAADKVAHGDPLSAALTIFLGKKAADKKPLTELEKRQLQSEWNNLRNRSIEHLYDPEVIERAKLIQLKYGADLQTPYDDILRRYEANYEALPLVNIVELNGARARTGLTEEARRRYEQEGIIPAYEDYIINIDPATELSQSVMDHEIGHINKYHAMKSPMAEGSILDGMDKLYKKITKKTNPIAPYRSRAFKDTLEGFEYGRELVDRMKRAGIKLTRRNVESYLKTLSNEDPVKLAMLQIYPSQRVKWLNELPLAQNDTNEEQETYYA